MSRNRFGVAAAVILAMVAAGATTSAAQKKPKEAAAAGAITYLSLGGIEQNLVYYWTPADLAARGESAYNTTIRLGGVVQERSLDWDPKALSLKFTMGTTAESGAAPSIAVDSTGAPPQMFREGIGAIVEGRYDGRVFRAERLMVKHSNEYHPPKVKGKAHTTAE